MYRRGAATPKVAGPAATRRAGALAALLDLGHQRRDHFVQVADDAVVRLGKEGRFAIGVDHQDVLGTLAAHQVLDSAADAAGNVQLRRNAGTGQSDLIRMRPPAVICGYARAADNSS